MSQPHQSEEATMKNVGGETASRGDLTEHPDFYTWTWDVWVSGGNWRAEYGWEKPTPDKRRIVRNVRPLFTQPLKDSPPSGA